MEELRKMVASLKEDVQKLTNEKSKDDMVVDEVANNAN